MTCIAGIAQDGVVWVGGDSAGVSLDDLDLTVRSDEKVFHKGDFLFGFSGSFRVSQLVRHGLKIPERKSRGENLSAYMALTFSDAVRKCLRDGGALIKMEETGVEEMDAAFIVGFRGKLYVIEADFQVAEPADSFAAIGCGAPVALGSLYSTKKLAPDLRVLQALKASERFNGGVRSPFVIKRIPVAKKGK